jgi:ribulose-phosphate 3-epimerase
MRIAPSILSADFAQLGDQIAQCEAAGADWIHLDVMDGRFVPNISFGPVVVAAARRVTRLPLDVHLMIEAPDRYLAAFAQAGADSLTVHLEACPHLHRTLQTIRGLGKNAGVALNPATPAALLSEVLDDVDLILAMTVNPGFSGQQFIAGVLPKVHQLAEMAHGREMEIEVDGGIDARTLPLAAEAGATVAVAASAVFKAEGGIAQGVGRLRQSVGAINAIGPAPR